MYVSILYGYCMHPCLTCSADLCLTSPVGCGTRDEDDEPIEASAVALEEVLNDGAGRDFLQKGKRHVLILPTLDT